MIRNYDGHLVDWAVWVNGAPFQWGVVDCVSLALEAAEIMTDADVYEFPAIGWHDRETFESCIHAAGGPLEILRSRCYEVGLRRMQTGDFLYTPDADPLTGLGSIAVVIRNRLLIVTPQAGVQLIPLAVRPGASAWRLDA